MTAPILLSAVLVVRTERDVPEPCLRSLSGLVDEVVIVLPTAVAAPRAAGIAVRMVKAPSGDTVAALDAGLAKARGAFVLAIASTERVTSADRRRLAALLADASVHVCRVRFKPRPGSTRCWEPRLFRRDPQLRFRALGDEPLRLLVDGVGATPDAALVDSDVEIDGSASPGSEDPGEQARAVELLQARLAHDPADVTAWTMLGSARLAGGDQRRALRAWRRAIHVARRNPSPDGLDSLPYMELLRHAPLAGWAHLDEARRLFPDNYFFVWCHASRLVAAGRYRQALPHLGRLVAVEPRTYCDRHVPYDERIFGELAHAALGLCHFRLGRYRESADHFRKAEAAAPLDLGHRVKRHLAELRGRGARPSGTTRPARRRVPAIDIVTPLHPPDIGRFAMLRASLDRFWRVPGRHLVPVQDAHYEEVAAALRRYRNAEVVRESTYIDTTAGQVSGRVSMQLRKLGAHQIARTPFYLCLDADTLVVRPCRHPDIVRDGRGRADLCDAPFQETEYERAAELLGVEKPSRRLMAGPQLFSVEMVAAALARLSAIHGGLAWQEILSARAPWSDSAIYYTYAARHDLVDRHHSFPRQSWCAGLWSARDAETWSFDRAIAPGHVRFCVIESTMGVPAAWAWERVKHHFPRAAGPPPSDNEAAPPDGPGAAEEPWAMARAIAARPPLISVPPPTASESERRRRVLVVAHRIPTPDRTSESVRLMFLLKGISAEGWDVTLVSAAERAQYVWVLGDVERELPRYEAPLAASGFTIVYGLPAAVQHLGREAGTYSLALLSSCHVMYRFAPLVRAYMPWARLVYDVVDLYWVRVSREAAVNGNDRVLRAQADRYRRMDGVSFEIADGIVAITEEERDRILEVCPGASVTVVPNIHEPSAAPPGLRGRAGTIFIGHYLHTPNVDAVRYFCREVLPRVHAGLPGVEFRALGSSMPDSIAALRSAHIHPIGYVADPAPHFDAARVFVAPLRYGAGMKGKIGQSLSLGLPLVTTPVGAEGMGLTHGEDVLIADGAQAFADAVCRLHTDDRLWERLSEGGLRYIRRRVSPEAVAPALRHLLTEARQGAVLG